MAERARIYGAAVLAGVASLVGCGGGDGGGGSRQDFVDALVEVSSENEAGTLTAEQESCFAEAIVDAVGVERLGDATSPDEILDQGTTSVADLGVDVDEADGTAYYERVSQCVDLRTVLVQSEVGTAEITDAAAACFEQNLTEDLVREFFVAGFVQTRDQLATDADLLERLQAVFTTCSGS
jgi:hypothetical protein